MRVSLVGRGKKENSHTERASAETQRSFSVFPVQPRLPSRQKHPHRSLPRSRSMTMGPESWLGFFVPDPWRTGDGGGVDVAS